VRGRPVAPSNFDVVFAVAAGVFLAAVAVLNKIVAVPEARVEAVVAEVAEVVTP
jgi:hypothetical protein